MGWTIHNQPGSRTAHCGHSTMASGLALRERLSAQDEHDPDVPVRGLADCRRGLRTSGIHQPDGGEIWLGDDRVSHLTPPTARALGIETVYQDLALCDNLSAIANVVLGQEPIRLKVGPIAFLNKKVGTEVICASS